MECEVCGKPIFGRPLRVVIEGSEMKTCKSCAKFGEVREIQSPQQQKQVRKRSYHKPKQEHIPDVVGDYNDVIRKAREKNGLTQEELGLIINEKASVINRLESKRMSPSISLAKKLERALEIKLLEESEESSPGEFKRGENAELTIGDIIKVKKKG
ncbi:transcription factor [archaeon]|nr:transcription factor [archaeon]